MGSELGRELARGGHTVFGVRRDPAGLPAGIEGVAADLGSLSSLRESFPEGADALVYCAAPSERGEQAYERTYVAGLTNVLETLHARGEHVGRVLFTSSTAVYAQDDGSLVDERSPAEPARPTGVVLRRAEAITLGGPHRGVVLRLAGIYGPGRTWLVRRVAQGLARRSPGAPRYGNRIHVRDCAGALAHLLALASPEPIFVGVDQAPVPLDEVYDFVADLLGVPRAPEGDDGEGRGGNKRCSSALLRASGYALRVPSYREGYPEIVRELFPRRA